MRLSAQQQQTTEARIRAAMDRLLRGDLPPGGKCDLKTMASQAGISRSTLYSTYPHLKTEFEQRRQTVMAGGAGPDPRDAQIQRLKHKVQALTANLAAARAAEKDFRNFKTLAISQLAAMHDELERVHMAQHPASGSVRPLRVKPS